MALNEELPLQFLNGESPFFRRVKYDNALEVNSSEKKISGPKKKRRKFLFFSKIGVWD